MLCVTPSAFFLDIKRHKNYHKVKQFLAKQFFEKLSNNLARGGFKCFLPIS